MAKTAGNVYEWIEHDLTVFGKGGYRMRKGNTFNLLGGELPSGQSFALFIKSSSSPIQVIDDVSSPTKTRSLYDYAVAPFKRPLDHTKVRRIVGNGLEDFALDGIFTGTRPEGYRFKISAAGLTDQMQVRTASYSAGTASQSTDTISGSGTTWTTAMVGANFTFADETNAGTITEVSNTTSLKVDTSQTVSSQGYVIDGGATFLGAYGGATFLNHPSGSDPNRLPIADGIGIKFGAITGHSASDEWEFWTPMPQHVEAAKQTQGTGEILTTAVRKVGGAGLIAEALDNSETEVTVDSSHGIVVNDVIAVGTEKMLVTGVSTDELTVTRGYAETTAVTHLDNTPVNILVTASHRQVFVVKIISGHATNQNTFKYSTDGGVTFDNGGGSTDGSGNLNIPGSPFTHTLRDSNNVSYGITITFSGIAGYTTNDAFSFHAFPVTSHKVFTPNSETLLIAWVENITKRKLKHQFFSGASLGDTANLNLPSTMAMSDTGLTLSAQTDSTAGARIKLTENAIMGFTSSSTNDKTHKYFELNKDGYVAATLPEPGYGGSPALFMGKPTGTAGVPLGMEPGLIIENGNIFLSAAATSATTGHISAFINFDANSGASVNSQILQYDGVVTSSSTYDGRYGFKGLWVGGYSASDNLILTGTNVYPWQNGTYTATALTTESGAGSNTLTDAQGGFNAGMIGRPITRTTDGATGTITAVASSSSATTTGISWASDGDEDYKLLKPANTYTNALGRIGNGVSTGTEYSTTATDKASIHQLFHNIAAHVFEGQTLRLWAKESDGWSTYMNADPVNVGHCIELGLAYNASGGYSYKINFPNEDTAPSVNSVLRIASITTSGTNINGSKDQPYRIELEWDTGGGMVDALLYG